MSVLYFKVGAWEPWVNKLNVTDVEEVYKVVGFENYHEFINKAKKYEKGDESAWFAVGKDGLVLIEGYLYTIWVRDYPSSPRYERDLAFYRVVMTKELFEEAKRDPILAIRLAKVKCRRAER